MRITQTFRLLPVCILFLGLSTRAFAAPTFFVIVRGVEEAPSVGSGILEQARALFTETLTRRPEITLVPPSGFTATDVNQDKAVLQANKLTGIELTLRILAVELATDPAPPGKHFRVLKRGVRLSVFGTRIPEKIVAIGGDGDAQIAAEIRSTEIEETEGKKLLLEAVKVAIGQAVDMTVTKLKLAGTPAKKKKRP